MPHPDNFDQNRGVRYVEGTVFTDGANAFPTATVIGNDFTATRTGVGTATIKINVVARAVLDVSVTLSRAAVAARFLQVLGRTQGTDGMWTIAIALTTMDGTTGTEWAAANAAAFICFRAELSIGDTTV